jgi:tetratricopeptide (TPR) repeat protein
VANSPLDELVEAERFDEALSALSAIEASRILTPWELVLKGRCIQLSSVGETPALGEAERYFLDALKQDGEYVPALLELGWFYYSVEDEAKKALPVFEQAVAVSLKNLREGLQGKRDCLKELRPTPT